MRRDAAPAAIAAALSALSLALVAMNNGSHDVVAGQELAIVVWTLIGVGWASGRLPRATIPRGVQAGFAGAALVCAVCALSLAWTESDARTAHDLARDVLYLGVLVLAASLLDRRTAPWAVFGCLLAGAAVTVVAMTSRLWPGPFPADDTARIFETSRLSYPLNYWNALGATAAATLALALAWAAHARASAARVVGLAVAPVAAGVIFLTYSRAALAGVAIAIVLLLIGARNRATMATQLTASVAIGAATVLVLRHHRQIAEAQGTAGAVAVGAFLACASVAGATVAHSTRALDALRMPRRLARRVLIAGTAVAAIAAVSVGPHLVSKAWDQFSRPSTTDTTDPVARLGTLSGYRYEIFDSALRAFREHPFKGTGSGTFEFWFNRDGGRPQLRDAHSLLLEPMAELGVLGLGATLALLVALAAALVAARRRARAPTEVAAVVGGIALFGVWVVQAGVDWLWEVPGVTALALVGVTAAAMVAADERRGLPSGALRAGVAALALVAVVVQLPGISATRHLRASERAGKAGDLALARAEAEKATAAEPWNSATWAQLGVIDEAAGRDAHALGALGRAEQLEPTNWRWPYLRARLLGARGRDREALAALRRARRLRPASPFLTSATR